MTLPLKNDVKHTIDDIYRLPDNQRAELIDGELYLMAPPSYKHQITQVYLLYEIEHYIREKNGDCKVISAPFAVFIYNDDYNYVEPDISVVCDKDILDDRGCNGAPDFIIEIVSPSSRKLDYQKKMNLYADAGVREYWIVDLAKEKVTVYYFEEDESPHIYTFKDKINVNIYDDLEIDFARLQL